MTATVRAADVAVGTELPEQTFLVTRADLVRNAGASGDFNPNHWNDRVAAEVGLPGVIAHGMLTMALAVGPITQWAGNPGAVIDYRTRFTKPVVVPDAESGSPEQPTVELAVTATVGAVDEDNGTVRLDVYVTAEDTSVLGRTQVKVRLA